MKIQCTCGAKYAFDVTPEMAATPVRLVCQDCGADLSSATNHLIRQQFAASATLTASVPTAVPLDSSVAPAPTHQLVAGATSQSPVGASSTIQSPASPAAPTAASPPQPAPQLCLKHAGQVTTHRCLVCQKPICPRCMEMFGYVCSVYCQEAAAKVGLEVPSYERQLCVVRAKARKKAWLIGAAVTMFLLALLGLACWYQFVGSKPHVVYAAKFTEEVFEGRCKLVSAHDALLLRGGRLSRHNIAGRKEVWSIDFLNREQIEERAAKFVGEPEAQDKKLRQRRTTEGLALTGRSPDLQSTLRDLEHKAAADIRWHVHGQDLWIGYLDKMTRFDWQTGKAMQEIPLPGLLEMFFPGESAIVVVAREALGQQIALRIDLATGDVQREAVALPKMTKPGKRTAAGISPKDLPGADLEDFSRSQLIGGQCGLVQLTVKLLEAKSITVQAMKAPPKKSALEGEVNAAATVNIANEMLNEWERDRTGGVQQEDVSRYQVILKRLFDPSNGQWTGEVSGPPELFPLQTVDVLIAGKNILVFDKTGRKLWDGKLAYTISGGLEFADDLGLDDSSEHFVPCIERGNTLFVFDQGVLAAFDLASGNARWRLPSVGISRLLSDEQGSLYIDTTDAEQDQLRYSQQIDVERKTRRVILKVDAQSGKILWRSYNNGRLAHVSDRFVYSIEYAPGDDNAKQRPGVVPAHIRIYRLDYDSGLVAWEHYQPREPIALDFRRHRIQVLFKKEMQVLKFISL